MISSLNPDFSWQYIRDQVISMSKIKNEFRKYKINMIYNESGDYKDKNI